MMKTAQAGEVHVDSGHGRVESRQATVITDLDWLQSVHQWPGLKAIGRITRRRELADKTTEEAAYYLLSDALSLEQLVELIRQHWGIENRLHWVLDVTMQEDQSRQRKDHGPEKLALLRRLAFNVAKLEPSKGSMKAGPLESCRQACHNPSGAGIPLILALWGATRMTSRAKEKGGSTSPYRLFGV